ncbi:MAG: hypothetical protein AMJ65_05605 [Phycisphaerae bacterium SG8_4]|nr:MAG: hypothetical protein AMJ65_05605 [Phycisphaerae bacterium SG8_4]
MFLKVIFVPSYIVSSNLVLLIKSKKYLPQGKFPFIQEEPGLLLLVKSLPSKAGSFFEMAGRGRTRAQS